VPGLNPQRSADFSLEIPSFSPSPETAHNRHQLIASGLSAPWGWIYKMTTTEIYGLVDPRNQQLRYVGKTSCSLASRLRQHINDAARAKVNLKRFAWLNELRAAGLKPEIFELETVVGAGWQDAERYWISYFKFVGANLCNATEGGDGIQGFVSSEETKRKRSLTMTQTMADPAMRVKYSEALKRAYADPLVRGRLVEALRKTWTPERRVANAAFLRDLANRPEQRLATSIRHKGKVLSTETRAKISAARKGQKPSPEIVAARAAAHRGLKHNP
jgi:hypothetical protein